MPLTSHSPEATIEELNTLDPEDLLAWTHAVHGNRAGVITSFQNTGLVMIDMCHRMGLPMRVLTVDTLRLHPETYELMDEVEQRYGITIERFQPDPERLSRMVEQHGEYLFFDSQEKQEFCCHVRKVEPNERALATVDAWITGLRRDQSSFRKGVEKASYITREGRRILKLAPLAAWGEEEVQAYVDQHGVPHNKLYDQGYTTIGCVICTTPVRPGEDKRAGRWRWFNHMEDAHKKECGIHIGGSGI
jgi:phosphoadenosine phosphosulfate reductase